MDFKAHILALSLSLSVCLAMILGETEIGRDLALINLGLVGGVLLSLPAPSQQGDR